MQSGAGLEPDAVHLYQQPQQFATLTSERRLQLKNSANARANVSVQRFWRHFWSRGVSKSQCQWWPWSPGV